MIKRQKITNGRRIPFGLKYRIVQNASTRLNKYASSENIMIGKHEQQDSSLALEEMVSTQIELLSSKKVRVRANAALELGHLGTVKGIPILCKALSTDLDPTVRLNAAKALGMIGKKEPVARNSVN